MARRRSQSHQIHRSKPHYLANVGLSFVALSLFTVTGLRLAAVSSAATTNPYGYADFCALENNVTVIYGWASDPNASSLALPSVTLNAGGKAVTAATNRAGYRDAQVNAWIDQNRAGDPKPGTYGFRAEFPGLYKGPQHTLTGTALNEGPGSSVILSINNSGYTDGDRNKPYFAGNVIPQACLANTPAPATTAPAPKPAPATPAAPSVQPGASTPAATASSLSNAADGAPTAGTLAANIDVPAGGAAKVHINYGTSPLKLDQNTPDQDVTGDKGTVSLTGLDPTTQYTYTIIRSAANGQTTTSAPAAFSTLGFVITLHFVDSQNKGIQGISANLDGQKANKISGNSGNSEFTNISAGDHTVSYTYNDKKFSKKITAGASAVNPTEAASAKVVTLDHTINVQKAVGVTEQTPQKSSNLLNALIPIIVILLAFGLVLFGILRRRRKQQAQSYYEDFPAAPSPEYQPVAPAVSRNVSTRQDSAAHMGESLKDMVLRSMAEEAKRREDSQK